VEIAGHTKMNEAPLTKAELETLSEFRYQLRRFHRWSEELTRRAGITNLQYLLMLHVAGFPGREWATITELAERLQAKHHGVVALASRCEKRGLVERRPGRSDGREVEIHLTRKGSNAVARLARLHRDELVRLEGIFAVPGKVQLARTRQRKAQSGEGAA
jgi:DNA-binding MarR family transcriptional regulator